jgi:hypothetical protein
MEDMLVRAAFFALLVVFCSAQTVLTIEQLYSFIKSSVQLKHPDKQVAGFLRNMKLKERLDERTIEDLQGYGAGPKTLEALRELAATSAALPAPAPRHSERRSAIPPPSPDEQERVLAQARETSLNFDKTLPDFICTQVTRRYADPSGLEFWRLMDTLTARLSYFERKEDYKLVMVNNAVVNLGYEDVGGAIRRGDFGTMLRDVFEEQHKARFQWERWATLRGRRTHVFAYTVPQPFSELTIAWERKEWVKVGYKGLVYVDRETNKVTRIVQEATEIPPSFPISEASTILDYDYVDISGSQYLLPLRAVTRTRAGKLLTKNETEFRLYRKFAAEATLTFTPEALPEEQTQEQPPQ